MTSMHDSDLSPSLSVGTEYFGVETGSVEKK